MNVSCAGARAVGTGVAVVVEVPLDRIRRRSCTSELESLYMLVNSLILSSKLELSFCRVVTDTRFAVGVDAAVV